MRNAHNQDEQKGQDIHDGVGGVPLREDKEQCGNQNKGKVSVKNI